MAFADKEYSIASAEPFELYDFVRGTWNMYLTTRPTQFWVSDAQIYEPAPIEHDKLRKGDNIKKDTIALTVPRGHNLAAQFINVAPEETTSVTIRRLHRGLTFSDARVIWKGRVIGAEPRGEKVEIACESIYTSMRRYGLRLRAELICQHTLYQAGCGADKPSKRFDDTISAIDGSTLTMSSASGYADGWFSGGVLETDSGDSRFVLSHTGNTIKLTRPLTELEAGMEVALYPGCDRIMDTCENKFSNLDNYLGFPWIPDANPFQVSIK